jgi:uncharacterized protein
MKRLYIILLFTAILIVLSTSCRKVSVNKTLIITGQSTYNWKVSSEAIKQILDETGLFSSVIIVTPPEGEDLSDFNPNFSKYKLIVLDYEGDPWPDKTNIALMDYVSNGGGVVLYNSKSDPWAAVADSVTVSKRHDFEIRTHKSDHPVMKGLPLKWLHPDDKIVQGMKLSGDDAQILATAFADALFSGTGKREPVLVARNYDKGRIFATLLGTPDEEENSALHCAGFIVTLQRGAEWAATGLVTQEVPFDFPTASDVVIRHDYTEVTLDEAFENIGSYDISKSTKYLTCIQSSIRKAAGDEITLLTLEKRMVGVLTSSQTSNEAKKLLLHELSWIGTDYTVNAISDLANITELKDDVEFALKRLKQ